MPTATPPKLTLYLLCQYPERPMAFAPHGWKSVLPMRYLGVHYETHYVTLAQLREELPKKLKLPKVTLPTLVVTNHDGEETIMMDSYNIAQYLEAHYATSSKSLYFGDVGRHFSRFMEQWVDRSLAVGIRLCVLHTSYARFPEEGPHADLRSKAAFLAKCGQARMDELTALNADAEWTKARYAEVRKELGTIEVLLQDRIDRGETGLFLGGEAPIHADFCVYAFYPYSRTNGELVNETWHHESFPLIRRWLSAFEEIGLVTEADLPAM